MGALIFSLAAPTIFGNRTANFGETRLTGSSPYGDSANFVRKLSENSHERANLLAIRRLMAT
jgi:hypothetical protein